MQSVPWPCVMLLLGDEVSMLVGNLPGCYELCTSKSGWRCGEAETPAGYYCASSHKHKVAPVVYVEDFDVLSDVLYGQRHRHWRYHTASKWLCLRWPQCISFAASILATQSMKQSTSPTRIGFIRKVICLSNSVAIRPNGTHQWRLSRTQCSSISAQRKARVCAVCHK